MQDAGLLWNPKKCKYTALKRGKYCHHEDITLNNGDVIKCLKEDDRYEFMGVPQNAKIDSKQLGEDMLKVVEQRSHIIWSSGLSDKNKCKASNQFVNSAVEYFFWTVKFTIDLIREMDKTVRKVMDTNGAKHTLQLNVINYLPRNKGGRGLRSLEETYKVTKIKLAVKLMNDHDQRMEIVRQYHKITSKSTSFSVFKDAMRYAQEFDIKMELVDDNLVIVDEEITPVKSIDIISNKLKVKSNLRRHTEILNSTWQGLNLKQRIEDENVIQKYFTWLQNWQSCPTDVVHEFFLLFFQLLKTRCYVKFRSNEVIEDIRCRLCGEHQESVKHIISNCGTLAKSLYISRHDNALKCFVWPLLNMFGLIDKLPCWYATDKVKPYYCKEKVYFWWDIPEYTGRDDESEHPPRPDGKFMFENDNERKLFLIEMTVPWISNRRDKFEYKAQKYLNIQQNLKFEYPNYDIDQITLVMDVFGGYGQDLLDNIGKVISNKSTVATIVKNMQKSIVSNAANLSRTFKIRSMVSNSI